MKINLQLSFYTKCNLTQTILSYFKHTIGIFIYFANTYASGCNITAIFSTQKNVYQYINKLKVVIKGGR